MRLRRGGTRIRQLNAEWGTEAGEVEEDGGSEEEEEGGGRREEGGVEVGPFEVRARLLIFSLSTMVGGDTIAL